MRQDHRARELFPQLLGGARLKSPKSVQGPVNLPANCIYSCFSRLIAFQQPIHRIRSDFGNLSIAYRQHIGSLSVACRQSIGSRSTAYRQPIGSISIVYQQHIDSLQVAYRQTIDSLSIVYRQHIGILSVAYRQSIDSLSVAYRSDFDRIPIGLRLSLPVSVHTSLSLCSRFVDSGSKLFYSSK